MVTGQYIDPRAGRVTLSDFYRGRVVRQVWETGTRAAVDLAVRSSGLDAVPLGSLRRSHVEAWVKVMSARSLAPGTVATRIGNVRAVLRRDRVIRATRQREWSLPHQRKNAAAMTIPTVAEVGRLLAACDPVFRAGVALAAFAGLCLGEVCGAQAADIRFLTSKLDVRRQVQRATGGEVEIRPLKYGSERTVYLANDLVRVLAQHTERLPDASPARWLFVGEDGVRPLHQNSACYHWRRAGCCRTTGGPVSRSAHFYESGLTAAGCDVVTVQHGLGHGTATVTLNTYAHLWPSAEDRTRKAAAPADGRRVASCGLADP